MPNDEHHEHKFRLKMGIEEITGTLAPTHVYAECECGAELDAEQIEEIINAKR